MDLRAGACARTRRDRDWALPNDSWRRDVRPRNSLGLTFFRSAATCLHSPAARRKASRQTRRGSAGPTNGTWSAAAKSWAADAFGDVLRPPYTGANFKAEDWLPQTLR